jgi:fructose-bisphosphate aldolase class II
MGISSTQELVNAARDGGVAALAFNVIGLEHAEAVVSGAEAAGLPVIMQVSANAIRFRGAVEPLAAACLARAEQARVPVALHLDHAESLELCRRAVAAGFSSAMFDAASADYEQNLAATRQAAAWARQAGAWLEGELGEIAGKPGARAGELTDPLQAREFVAATGVDGLAVAVGSRHKMTATDGRLDLERIAELREAVSVPLVLHGSSGIADAHLREAVDAGIVKVNVGTRLALAYTAAVRQALCEGERLPDPRALLDKARAAMTDVVRDMLAQLATPAAAGSSVL